MIETGPGPGTGSGTGVTASHGVLLSSAAGSVRDLVSPRSETHGSDEQCGGVAGAREVGGPLVAITIGTRDGPADPDEVDVFWRVVLDEGPNNYIEDRRCSASSDDSIADSSSSSCSGSRSRSTGGSAPALVAALLQLAARRLIAGGRLAFWLPTRAEVDEREVRAALQALQDRAHGDGGGGGGALMLERVTAETLNGNLWRWLCVFSLQ
jgi:hypothetical protein